MIRLARQEERDPIVSLVINAKLFAAEDSSIIDQMLADYFAANHAAGHSCIVDIAGGELAGVAYYQPVTAADRVWDLTMIAIRPQDQRLGRGAALLAHVERSLRNKQQRLLLIETSGLPAYDRARSFYLKSEYDQEARIRDYWADGDDMILFRKALGASGE